MDGCLWLRKQCQHVQSQATIISSWHWHFYSQGTRPLIPKVNLIDGSIESMTLGHGFDRRKNAQESHSQPEDGPIKLVGIHFIRTQT